MRWANIRWVPNADGIYSRRYAWNALIHSHPIVPWGTVAWFPHQRHGWGGFIQWPTMSGRLSSMDRLKAWGVIQANDCPEQWG